MEGVGDAAMILSLGNNGECSVIDTNTTSPAESIPDPILHALPFGAPPILKQLDDEIRELITNPKGLIMHDLDRTQRLWPRKPDLLSLLHTNLCPCSTTLKMDRDETTGEIINFHEEEVTITGKTAKNSMSLLRMPGPPVEALCGNVTNYAFWPGGMDEPSLDNLMLDNEMIVEWQNDMQTVPPGFEYGMTFTVDQEYSSVDKIQDNCSESSGLLSIMDLMMPSEDFDVIASEKKVEISGKPHVVISEAPESSIESPPRKTIEWAEALPVNVPVSDFDKLVPSLAHKWPFELDTFQKQAIICLERQESIFVAAHTSSGKTVVAEYAVALSRKHMTRTIYTSPIKALSNQKFREFKATFEDVGLVTGDIQIKPEASCLIMTTEILRSMLYNGSDVVRELEWVIFDEVHYINDHERGVVWEEVLIMLPQHVNLVMLSATVPNTLQFADWVGRTKKKKIYVISTDRRPVPLEHFLYLSSGSGAQSKDGMFCILGPDGKFNTLKYNESAEAKKNVKDKKQAYGPKGPRSVMNPQQERNLLLAMLHFLQKKDKLPVIVFTLSRRRCDTNCAALTSLDLTTASEKNAIHDFTQKCIQKLKGSDRQLPQVCHLMELLKRGLGVHHSGILPILKEVVEMLFHRGLVKVLFATETFAMGVNMPARTVVFDSITKHDGVSMRNLRPSEYIQMAGRAGRRGLDTTGTVIILCKGTEVPPAHELNEMMLGNPTILESKFRLTYTMILNLLRVRDQHLRVEDMMKRSFSEVATEKKLDGYQKNYKQLLDKSNQMKDVECTNCKIDCQDFYDLALQYIKANRLTMESMAGSLRSLSPGRVVIIAFPTQGPTLGVIVATFTANSNKEFWSRNVTVVHLWEQSEQNTCLIEDPDWLAILAARSNRVFVPEGSAFHRMVDITMKEVVAITSRLIKLDALKVIADCRKRQQVRFSQDLPNQAVQGVIRELVSLSRADSSLDDSNVSRGMDVDVYELWHRARHLKSLFDEKTFSCTACPSFVEHLLVVHQKNKVNAELKFMEHKLSDDRLALLPEYHCRIHVLQNLHYLDDSRMVKLKGRVACEMSNHELLLTELILENLLTERNAAEIAALLSCIVFQAKTTSEAKLTNSLKEGIVQISDIYKKIENVQKECGMLDDVSDYSELNFGLVDVVYEWARGVPFSTIMAMTDVQEGIIVRCIQRLDEVLGYLKNASRIVGEPTLYCKADEASRAIKRDIVFAASLYTQ